MYQPTTRVLSVLELLQAHPQLSGSQLARYLEVDIRSVRRYILMLQDLGIPVEANTGRSGGYRLRPGYKPPPLIFTTDEVLAVAIGLIMVKQVGIDIEAGAIESAGAKIGRILSQNLREQVQAIQQNIVIDTARSDVSVMSKLVTTLGTAVRQKRQVHINYSRGETRPIEGEALSHSQERVVEPYSVIYFGGRWYLVGYCHLRQGIRNFRLDRIQKADILTATFTPPDNFDGLQYLIDSIANIPDQWQIEVILAGSIEEIRPLVPPTFATLTEHPEGVLFKAWLDNLERVARFIVGLGFPVIACEPPELRQAFGDLANQLATINS